MFPKDKWKLGSLDCFSNFPDLETLTLCQFLIKAVIPSKYVHVCVYGCTFNNFCGM